jgi:ABC-type dipeptide/oligopeptide/nickel transport system permease component
VPLGISAAVHRNSFIDYFNRIFSLLGLSVPAFYLGIILILVFSIIFPIFPVVGGGEFWNPKDNLRHLVLPGLSLGLLMMAYVTRMTRSAILDVLREDYVRTAHAKGVIERLVLYKHVLRNALIPIVALGGLYAVVLIGSSVMVEIVFTRPGLGKLMVGAIKQRDYTTLQSVMVIYAVLVVVINLATDLIYGFIDPRIKYD